MNITIRLNNTPGKDYVECILVGIGDDEFVLAEKKKTNQAHMSLVPYSLFLPCVKSCLIDSYIAGEIACQLDPKDFEIICYTTDAYLQKTTKTSL